MTAVRSTDPGGPGASPAFERAADLADEGQFDIYDINGDNQLDQDEFNTFQQDEALTEDDLLEAEEPLADEEDLTAADSFERFDANDDDQIDENEFGTVLATAGIANADQFDTYDADNDERLSQSEFSTFLEDEDLTGADLTEGR